MLDTVAAVRFWQKSWEATFHFYETAFALTLWQARALSEGEANPLLPVLENRNWLNAWSNSWPNPWPNPWNAMPSPVAPLADSWQSAVFWCGTAFPEQTAWLSGANMGLGPNAAETWMKAISSWPVVPWSWVQPSLVTMMISAGLPYAVANPASKASTAALTAAEVWREQTAEALSLFWGAWTYPR